MQLKAIKTPLHEKQKKKSISPNQGPIASHRERKQEKERQKHSKWALHHSSSFTLKKSAQFSLADDEARLTPLSTARLAGGRWLEDVHLYGRISFLRR